MGFFYVQSLEDQEFSSSLVFLGSSECSLVNSPDCLDCAELILRDWSLAFRHGKSLNYHFRLEWRVGG